MPPTGPDSILFEIVMPFISPPILGLLLGWVVGRRHHRPALACAGGLVGGTLGAWAGILLYRQTILPQGANRVAFSAIEVVALALCAFLLARVLAGPKTQPGAKGLN
jgi:hypothetical protein